MLSQVQLSDPAPAVPVSDATPAQRYDVVGTGISVTTPGLAVKTLIDWSSDTQGRYVCIRDMHGIMLARRDKALAQIHAEADMVTPDGMPVALLGKLRGLPVERTCGPDLMLDAFAAPGAAQLSHYLYGGRKGIAQELAAQMRSRFPGARIAGTETPPFTVLTDKELAEVADRINRSGAHIVWVGLSTPKQEYLMSRLAPLISATLIGVGAAFDIHSGQIARAPLWMRPLCLEGIYRLILEPKRLWRRYLVLGPQFLLLAGAQHLRLRFSSRRAAN